ncbi:MAG: hypothetical protein A3D64_02415 [Candidatus Wildermuthbacteria bacterium RIFCSPHIGHO2_02_FULL_49_9]|uniref:GIY-YIG domain-containing protein n=1 Tax=Candidatus Wildermuthbacteria bacterium RIFCSPHIGHO2_02_FULL_49_9 TaxID=1802456 RepID=A0A1G2REE6_9BACT|nr:MAG: hypothetical protein A3D64_02415 [Candidatus Wildermuthbacteria bacterium RIFCSPHIGHO2_02_FULL_49_9]
MFCVYILQGKNKRWYTGSASDLRKRFNEHNARQRGCIKQKGPRELICYEACLHEQGARSREIYLKSGIGKRYLKNRLKRFLSLTG